MTKWTWKSVAVAATLVGIYTSSAIAGCPQTDGSNLGGSKTLAFEPCPEPDYHLSPTPTRPSDSFVLASQSDDPGFIIIIINIG